MFRTKPVATQAQCANTGLSAAQYGTVDPSAAGQFNLITGGNPNLVAERGETTTFGVVITPSMIEDLTICLLYTSPSPRDLSTSRMPSSA